MAKSVKPAKKAAPKKSAIKKTAPVKKSVDTPLQSPPQEPVIDQEPPPLVLPNENNDTVPGSPFTTDNPQPGDQGKTADEGLTPDANDHPAAADNGNNIDKIQHEEPGNQQPATSNEPTASNTEVAEQQEEEAAQGKQYKPGRRNGLTGLFTEQELRYIQQHIDARITAGLTKNNDHFIRQCVNFCVNYQRSLNYTFGRADIPRFEFE